MKRYLDLKNQRFGKLTVKKLSYVKKMAYWECLCDCGNIKIAAGKFLRNGRAASCGCINPLYNHSLLEGFSKHYQPTSKDLCWEWTGTINNRGYGKFSYKNKSRLAHRVSYELLKGKIPQGFFACHTCDNRKCVNPDHIYAGTVTDNNRDTAARSRSSPFYNQQRRSEQRRRTS